MSNQGPVHSKQRALCEGAGPADFAGGFSLHFQLKLTENEASLIALRASSAPVIVKY